MADKEERTEDPTSRRQAQARAEGQVFKSQEVLTVGMLICAISVLAAGAPWAFEKLGTAMASIFRSAAQTELSISSVQGLAGDVGFRIIRILMPFMAVLMVAGIALNLVQSGWNFTFKPVAPKMKKINPVSGIKRIFSKQGLFQFAKSFLKIIIVGPVAYLHIRGLIPQIVLIHQKSLEVIFATAGLWIVGLFFKIIFVLLFLSALDFVYERWKHKEDLKMTKQEVKDERKQSDGDPKIKKERMKLAMKILRRPRLVHAVADADVVVTNPTHYAVALKYDPDVAPAPRVLVKGIRKRALRIRQLALEQHIPVIEEPPLARALYRSVGEQQEIPEDLYPAVATLLAAVYRKRNQRPRTMA